MNSRRPADPQRFAALARLLLWLADNQAPSPDAVAEEKPAGPGDRQREKKPRGETAKEPAAA